MKTAISISDETFAQVERKAKGLGVSRSEFYSRAARHYLQYLDRQSLTDEINAALELVTDDSAAVAAAAGRRRLSLADDEW
ncbi:MAG TPA: ribbon-helix-helix protein, CopG family [Mycobacteriales bacterium]|jgi:metal-responsive CopG/Arc/MetJ family transcriptional regulator|nr:ribbon-helix-helix protein, CopG family [Mycobacteriales bacterium]